MRNLDFQTHIEDKTESSGDSYSPREMLLGQIVLVLLFTIAVLLRFWIT